MNIHSMQVMAGITSSLIFVSSNLPSLYKAFKTKDMKSYSLGQIFMGNVGNWVYWLYVRSLPMGPVWYLQAFFTTASGLMLFNYLRYEKKWFRFKKRNSQPVANPAFENHPCGNSRDQLDG
jgi:uncharacterized protein with PQ loop repeat